MCNTQAFKLNRKQLEVVQRMATQPDGRVTLWTDGDRAASELGGELQIAGWNVRQYGAHLVIDGRIDERFEDVVPRNDELIPPDQDESVDRVIDVVTDGNTLIVRDKAGVELGRVDIDEYTDHLRAVMLGHLVSTVAKQVKW